MPITREQFEERKRGKKITVEDFLRVHQTHAYIRDEVAEATGLEYWDAVEELDKLVSQGKVETTGARPIYYLWKI